MAKKALINREAKRVALAKKYAAKRATIFAVINDAKATDEERFEARLKLQAIPRNVHCSPTPSLCHHWSSTRYLPVNSA